MYIIYYNIKFYFENGFGSLERLYSYKMFRNMVIDFYVSDFEFLIIKSKIYKEIL